MELIKGQIRCLRIDYCRATRCWKCNNIRSCLQICDNLTKRLNRLIATSCDELNSQQNDLNQLKHLVWFLKVRCLAEDYYVSESLLLNEDDVGVDEQVRVFSVTNQSNRVRPTTTNRTNSTTLGTSDGTIGKRINTGSAIIETRQRTGMITGRMPSVSSRQSGRATTSYRPLTTSLTATQTAFSRSTRPLLKYSTCNFLSKPLFEYLYNAQAATNKCPDYRQCLEYLNLVQNTIRKRTNHRREQPKRDKSSNDNSSIISFYETANDERKLLGVFWLVAFGTCYFNLRMNKQAEEYFKLAITINPKFLDAYAWLVKIYLRSNQPMKVLKTCEDGLRECKNAILYNWMARVQSLICDSYAANSYLRESLNYYPTNIEALANVGHFAFYSDKLEQSLKCFERIQQLSMNQSGNMIDETVSTTFMSESPAELSNNLALCNFYCGFYHKVMPLFLKSFLNSSSKEVTSNIWYNISFVPMSCGFKNLAIACLRLALKNNSQNEEAINNLGVLNYGSLINDQLHYKNRQEIWGTMQQKPNLAAESELKNAEDQSQHQATLEQAETYFSAPNQSTSSDDGGGGGGCGADADCQSNNQPEMLYNMALIKKSRGQLLASVKYSNLYLEHDPNNYHITSMLEEIRDLVSHDS